MEDDAASSRDDSDESLVRRAAGDEAALAMLFERYRARLHRMVQLRLHPRLQGRLDPSDVLQEAYIDIARQLPYYLRHPEMDLFLWLRMVTGHRLVRLHRQHLGAAMRSAGREVSFQARWLPQASSVTVAAHLLARGTSPSQAVARAEIQMQLQAALEAMDPIDRVIIVLRHFEELSNVQAAGELGLSQTTASKRYVRALKRLQAILTSLPGLLDSY
jgi:RNA polymerase sigma-70 factor, ECF subfamily